MQWTAIPKRFGVPTITDHLFDCYFECTQASSDKRFRSAVNLLQNLDSQHAKVSVIVNLYSDDDGYSIVLCSRDGTMSEEVLLPYEDNEIFSYLDNQELSPILREVLKQSHASVLYEGCVICEVRDHRGKASGEYERQLLLLQPTLETILATVSKISHEMKCTPEERLFLESQLMYATQPPICLDPSTEVVCVTNRLHYNRRKFHSYSVRRYLRQMSHAYRARMNIRAKSNAPEMLKLNDFISKQNMPIKLQKTHIDFWKSPEFKALQHTPLDEIVRTVQQYAKSLPVETFTEPMASISETPPPRTLPSLGVPTCTAVDEFLTTSLQQQQVKATAGAKEPVVHITTATTTHPVATVNFSNQTPNLTQNITPKLPSGLLHPIAPASNAFSAASAPTPTGPVMSVPAVIPSSSTLQSQQAIEKAMPILKTAVASQAKLPSLGGTTTAVVVVSPLAGGVGGRAITTVSQRESLVTRATPPLRRPQVTVNFSTLLTSPNMQALPVLQRPPVISPQQVQAISSSLPKLNPLTPPKVLMSTAPSGKAQMPQLHKLSATVTGTSSAPQQPTPSLNQPPATVVSVEKDAFTTKVSSATVT